MKNQSPYEIGYDEYLRGRIIFLRRKVKELRNEIKISEELLSLYEEGNLKSIESSPKQLRIPDNPSSDLDFSVTKWKPVVFNYLYENPASFTTDQILLGTDHNKDYQKNKTDRDKAIKSISSSLFLLHKEGKISKHQNAGRRGFKWSIKEIVPSQLTRD